MTKPPKQISIGPFTVTGTANLLSANKAVQKLLSLNPNGLKKEAYRVNGMVITVKRATRLPGDDE